MKWLSNQNGYALLIILFLIVFIVTVTAVFMRSSISNAKQEAKVDDHQLSYVAAEMGVEYFQTLYENKYKEVRADIMKFGQQRIKEEEIRINKEIENDKIKTEVDKIKEKNNRMKQAEELVRGEMAGKLVDSFPKYGNFNAELLNSDYSYSGKLTQAPELAYDKNTLIMEVKLEGEFTGSSKKKSSELSAQLSFGIPRLLIDGESQTPPIGSVADWTWFQKQTIPFITKPSAECPPQPRNINCKATSTEQLKNSESAMLYFEGNIDKGDKGNIGKNFKGTKVYVEGNISEVKNFNWNNSSNIEIYSKGSVNLKNANSVSNSTIMSGENLYFDVSSLANMSLYSKGNLEIKQFDPFSNGKLFVGAEFRIPSNGGKANFYGSQVMVEGNVINDKGLAIYNTTAIFKDSLKGEGSTIINNNSTVCVGGSIDLSKLTIDSSSKIYYIWQKEKNKLKQTDPKFQPVDESVFNSNRELFYSNCKGTTSSKPPEWLPPKVDVNY